MTVAQGVLMGILLLAVLQDESEQLMPNVVPAFTLVGAILLSVMSVGVTPMDGAMGALVEGGLFFLMALVGNLGGGDVKMAFGIGWFLGWKLALMSFLFSLLAGFFYAMLRLIARKSKWGSTFAFLTPMCVGSILAIHYGISALNAWSMLVLGTRIA